MSKLTLRQLGLTHSKQHNSYNNYVNLVAGTHLAQLNELLV